MRKIFTIIFILFIFILPKNTFASTREYTIDNLNIEAVILQNGDIEVNEIIEYNFLGDFNGVFRDLNKNGSKGIVVDDVFIINKAGESIAVSEAYNEKNNTYQIIEDNDKTQIKLYCKSSNESKKFKFVYTIKGAAKKYETYSELNWNFYTVENVPSVKRGTLKLSLKDQPFDLSNFYYELFGDGEISSNNTEERVLIDFNKLTSLIGIKMKFQKDYLVYVDETLQSQSTNNDSDNTATAIIIVVFLAVGMISWGGLYYDLQKRKAIKEYREKYIFENDNMVIELPSHLPPALVNLLIHENYVTEEMLNPTLLYLANKGYYKLEERDTIIDKKGKVIKKDDLVFIRLKSPDSLEYYHLKFLMDWFEKYELKGYCSLQNLRSIVKTESNGKEFIDNLSKWKDAVKKDAEDNGFYIKIKNRKILENKWYNERSKWLKYKDYLINISSNDISESSYSINDYAIYGYALEISNKKLKEIIDLTKVNMGDNNSYQYYFYNYTYYTTLFNDINSNAHNSSSPDTDSSSNFGGISGGGDFNGGGGGGSGAF